MACVIKSSCGRKRSSLIWEYFDFQPKLGKSRCLACEKKGTCGMMIAGKNTTNLKHHLLRHHKSIYDSVLEIEKFKRGEEEDQYSEISQRKGCQISISGELIQWPIDSLEHRERCRDLINLVSSGYGFFSLADNPDFRHMVKKLEPRFALPSFSALLKIMREEFQNKTEILMSKLNRSRKITIYLDVQNRFDMLTSFVGISACFFDVTTNSPIRAFLNLKEISNPVTGATLSNCLVECLENWVIDHDNILQIVLDDDFNVERVIPNLMKKYKVSTGNTEDRVADGGCGGGDNEDECEISIDGSDAEYIDDSGDDIPELSSDIMEDLDVDKHTTFRCLSRLPQAIKLVTKSVYAHNRLLLSKARRLVHCIRISGKVLSELVERCGQLFATECAKRNSTYTMIKRLIADKVDVDSVLNKYGVDGLRKSEWTQLEEIVTILEPFELQLELLYDSLSLSCVLPSLLNLECHLQQLTASKYHINEVLEDFNKVFSFILNPDSKSFNPLAAAACLLNPSLKPILLTKDFSKLLHVAKLCIFSMENFKTSRHLSASYEKEITPLKKFKFLASRIEEHSSNAHETKLADSELAKQLNLYLLDSCDYGFTEESEDALKYWTRMRPVYPILSPIAEDLLASPASLVFVERIFSVPCLTSECREKKENFLELRCFLKLNNNIKDMSGI